MAKQICRHQEYRKKGERDDLGLYHGSHYGGVFCKLKDEEHGIGRGLCDHQEDQSECTDYEVLVPAGQALRCLSCESPIIQPHARVAGEDTKATAVGREADVDTFLCPSCGRKNAVVERTEAFRIVRLLD